MKLFLFSLFAVLLGSAANAQPVSDRSRSDVAFATAQYEQARRLQANLYNGVEHIRGFPLAEGHPFLNSSDWQTGTVVYNQITYRAVPLLYDLTQDRLVVQHPDSAFRIALVPELTTSFTLGKQTFTNIREENARPTGLAKGFYEILHRGRTELLAKRSKVLRSEISRNVVNNWFESQNQYFLQLNGTYHPLKTKKSVLKLAADNRKGLLRSWRDQKIRFRKNREQAFLEAARYFDTLNP